jgi:hypothetical protein
MVITDEYLLKCYVKGFRNELHGERHEEHEEALAKKAYQLGCDHAIMGDNDPNIDYLSNDEILKMILSE